MALLFVASAVFAQQSDSERIIAVNVDSTDLRIQRVLPELRQEAANVVEQSAKNVRAIIVSGSPSVAAEEARQNSADYLLRIDLSLLTQATIGQKGDLGQGPPTTADVPVVGGVPSGIAHSRCEDLVNEAFAFSYKITSMTGEKIKLQSSHTMREDEYPLGPQLNCLAKFSTRAVRECASDAVKRLRSKKKV